MKKIRHSVFETNSSSSHTISIAGDDKEFIIDPLYPNEYGALTIHLDEFGWEWFQYNSSEKKAAYAYLQGVDVETLKSVLKEVTGAEEVFFVGDGYIDHDSMGILNEYISDNDLKNFIFNKNSWLHGGNDNNHPSPYFYDVPEYTEAGTRIVTYDRSFRINNIELLKIKSGLNGEELEDLIDNFMDDYCYKDGEVKKRIYSDGEMPFETIDFDDNTITFFNRSLKWDVLKEIKKEFPDLTPNEINEIKDERVKELISQNPEKYQKTVHFEIKET